MTGNLNVKEQFDKQARKFDNWPVTRNEKILGSLYDFFGIEHNDHLLDVACGTGAFALYAAERTKNVHGVDISEGVIEVAIERAKTKGMSNLEFVCSDVEKIPFESNGFDSVVSKSAFHHMRNPLTVFEEMSRCCAPGGRVCLEDIIMYGDCEVDDYFEDLELEIDACHHRSLYRQDVINLYRRNDIEITRIFESISELNLNDYIDHAFQTNEARERVADIVQRGMQESGIAKWFTLKDGSLFWRRKVLTIAGRKS